MIRAEVAPGVTSFVRDGVAHIDITVDRRFRAALSEAVARDGGATARRLIVRALEQGPSRGGARETINHFGAELGVKLALTSEIVDGLEIAVNGFKKWLELTGFANDLTIVKGFVAWAEYKGGGGRVISGVKQAFERSR
jgi:hypothetical protein